MFHKFLDNSIFDTILAKAFLDAALRDIANFKNDDNISGTYPETYKYIERRKYNKLRNCSSLTDNYVSSVYK